VVAGDAAHAQRGTARYIAGPAKVGGRESDYFLFVMGNQPGLQRAVYEAIQAAAHASRTTSGSITARPDHQAILVGHRCCRHGFPARHPGRPDPPRRLRCRRYLDLQGDRARRHQPGRRPRRARRSGEARPRPVGHRIGPLGATPHTGKIPVTGYSGSGQQIMATCRNIAISLLLHRRRQLRSTALSRPSDATGPACPTTYRYETPITTTCPIPWGWTSQESKARLTQSGGLIP